jgi:hypothetical protein
VNAVFFVVKIFFLFPLWFFKRCVFYALLSSLLFVYFGCAGSVGIFWRVGSYTFSVCDSAMWSAGPVQVYLGILLERMAGLYSFFFFPSGSVVAGTVRLKWWGGGPSFLLSLVCCQFSWRLDVCGRILCYIFRFSLVNMWFFRVVFCFESC